MKRTSRKSRIVVESSRTRALVGWVVVVFAMGSVVGARPVAAIHDPGIPFFVCELMLAGIKGFCATDLHYPLCRA